MRFLFRLWESENEESWDQLSVCTQVLWNFMVYYNPEIFSDFINYLLDYTSYNISDNNLGMMLEAFYISVSELEITQSTNYAEIPTFSWISNGKDVYFNELHPYSNNKFSLQFFDVNDNLIFETNYIYSSYYTLSENEWNQLLSPAFLKYRVIIKSYATYGYETGPYYSSIYSFNKPNSANYSISLNNSRYYEKRIAIAQGTNWTFNVTFDNSGDKLIQTFGNKNTKMWLYDYDGSTLISSDDDSGYNYNAFIFSNLVSGRNYFLIVNLYNQNDYGMVKLSIISVGGFKNPNDLNITS